MARQCFEGCQEQNHQGSGLRGPERLPGQPMPKWQPLAEPWLEDLIRLTLQCLIRLGDAVTIFEKIIIKFISRL